MNRCLSIFAFLAYFAGAISVFGVEPAAKQVPFVTVSNPPPKVDTQTDLFSASSAV